MNTKELLDLLQSEAESIRVSGFFDVNSPPAHSSTDEWIDPIEKRIRLLRKYNAEAFLELESLSALPFAPIDAAQLNEFNLRIHEYLDEYAPDHTVYKRYIRVVSSYLIFLAKRPLHPVGMEMNEGQVVMSKGEDFFCPNKADQISQPLSVCRFCICKVL